MDFDVWSDGETLEKSGILISSLLIHSFGNDVFEIGSNAQGIA